MISRDSNNSLILNQATNNQLEKSRLYKWNYKFPLAPIQIIKNLQIK